VLAFVPTVALARVPRVLHKQTALHDDLRHGLSALRFRRDRVRARGVLRCSATT
jgi:hypothetical protein